MSRIGNSPSGLHDGDGVAFPLRRPCFTLGPRFFNLLLALCGRPRAALFRIAGPSDALLASRYVQICAVDLPLNCSYS